MAWLNFRSNNGQSAFGRFTARRPRLWSGIKNTAKWLTLGTLSAVTLYFSGGLAAIPFLAPAVTQLGAAIIAIAAPTLALVQAGLWHGVAKPLANLFRKYFSFHRRGVPPVQMQARIDSESNSPVNPLRRLTNNLNYFSQGSSQNIYSRLSISSSPKPSAQPATSLGESKSAERTSAALTLKGDKIDLSYMYDGLTIYYQGSANNAAINSSIAKCQQMRFIHMGGGYIVPIMPIAGIDKLNTAVHAIESLPGLGKQRNVHRDCDDHNLFHQDSFVMDRNHFHIKFNKALNQAQFAAMIAVFAQEGLITPKQHDSYINAFKQRLLNARNALDRVCSPSMALDNRKQTDFQAILGFIKACPSNDVLVDLHEYLLNPKFDYLREITERHPQLGKEWQGVVDQLGQIDKTSYEWAKIEKGISLQMIMNVKKQTDNLSPQLGTERSQQMAESHLFFDIKRSRFVDAQGHQHRTFKTLDAFKDADEEILQRKYDKIFGDDTSIPQHVLHARPAS